MASGIAIAGLVVNIFIPGVGTLINKMTRNGLIQLLVYLLGFFISIGGGVLAFMMPALGALSFLGGLMMFAMWVWGIVDGINLVKNS